MKAINGWQTGRLGELCSIQIGGTPSRSNPAFWDAAKETTNVWVSIKDLNQAVITDTAEYISDSGVKHSNVKLQKPGTVLLSFKLSIGRVAFAGVPLYTNEAIAGLNSERIDLNYLFHGLHQWDLLQGVDQAIKGATLNKEKLKKITFEYPTSPAEQTKIAEILSTVDRAIEQTEALIAKQQRIKTGLIQDLLTRGIDEHGNLRSEQTHEFKDSPLGRIPVKWDVKTLREVARGGAQNGFFKKPELVGSGYKLINVSEIYQSFGIDTNYDSVERVDATASDLSKYGVAEGDLFFTRSSLVLAGIAHCNLIQTIKEPTLFECHVIRIRPNKEIVVPEFLALFCQSIVARLFLMSRAKHVTMTTISQPELEALSVPVPPTLEEQEAIVDSFLSIERTIRHAESKKNKLGSLKTALMQDLLTGKKRVTALLNDPGIASVITETLIRV